MRRLWSRRGYWTFVVIGCTQLAALVAIGDSTITLTGILPAAALVIWLGFGSRAAWFLLVLLNAAVVLVTLAVAFSSPLDGGGVLWGDVITLVVGSALLLAVLMSPALRAPDRHPPLPHGPH